MATTGQVLQLRTTIENITADYLQRNRPMARYAVVATPSVAVDAVEVDVVLNGEPSAVTIPVGAIKPTGIGDVVRIEGGPSDRRITEVITPQRGQAVLSMIRTKQLQFIHPTVPGALGTMYVTTANSILSRFGQYYWDSDPTGQHVFGQIEADASRTRRFVMTGSDNYNFGRLIFRDSGDTFSSNDYNIGMTSATSLAVKMAANGLFTVARASDGQAAFVVRGNGTGNPQYEFQSVDTTTAAANMMVTGTLNQLRKVTSLGKDKLFQKDIPVNYKIFDIMPKTWLDRQMVAEDPNFKTRFGGAVAEQVNEVIGADMPTLLVWDGVTGALQSIAYERGFWHAIPTFKDMVRRIASLEGLAQSSNAAGVALEKRVKALEDRLLSLNIKL